MGGPTIIWSRSGGRERPQPGTLPGCTALARPQRPRRMDRLVSRLWGPVSTLGVVADGPSPAPRDPPPQASTVRAPAMVAALTIFTSGRAATPRAAPVWPHSSPLPTPPPPHSRGGARRRGARPPPPPRTARRSVPQSRSRRPAPLPRRPATLPARHPALPARLRSPSCPPLAHARRGWWWAGCTPLLVEWEAQAPPRGAAVVPLPSRAARVVVGSTTGPLWGLTAVAVGGGRGAGLGATVRGCGRVRLRALSRRTTPSLSTEP